MLAISGISKAYKQKQVLNDVSFTVQSGEICALLGLNGAGKSTLMKIICGLAFADSGEITLDEVPIINTKSTSGDIGFMIESPAFYKELTGKQNLTALAMLYDDIPKDRIDEVISIVGLTPMAKIQVKRYSLGMKQRLYFAYAILNKPKLLIIDEPFNGIDAVSINLFEKLIVNLASEGCTVIVSGHVISELQGFCNSAVIIDRGKVVYNGGINKEKDMTELFLALVSSSGDAQ